jgi:hypothetical protein
VLTIISGDRLVPALAKASGWPLESLRFLIWEQSTFSLVLAFLFTVLTSAPGGGRDGPPYFLNVSFQSRAHFLAEGEFQVLACTGPLWRITRLALE